MGFLDVLKRSLKQEIKRDVNREISKGIRTGVSKAVDGAVGAVKESVGKGKSSSQTFTFGTYPRTVEELKALPEATLDSAFKTTALAILALMRYEENRDDAIAMLNYLSGPESLGQRELQFLQDRLKDKFYKVKSFFEGATVENNYSPNEPLKITVYETPYSFDEENYATMYVVSAGADEKRGVKLRRKPSTNQWFITELQCLGDIRIPAAENAWA